jgi:beta-galactosidase/beta-glucuronidase
VKEGYFHLNGKRILVKSGHHQGTYPTTLEYPPTREFAYQEVRIFKEAGFNFCRLWVKPTPAPFLDAADELGLMVQEEPPLSLMVDSKWSLPRSLREVREMVKRDRNRPSIVVWNMINENNPPVKYVREQCRAARETDPTRLITQSAGGPSQYYLPYSKEGVSYLTEHPYAGRRLRRTYTIV